MIPFISGVKSVVDSILSRIPSNNATLVARLDDTVSSRASGSVWDAALKSYIQGIPQSIINSIQYKLIQVTVNSTGYQGSNTGAISPAVSTTKTIIIPLGIKNNNSNNSNDDAYAYWELTSGSVLTARVQLGPAGIGSTQVYDCAAIVCEFK